jgi:hypothetical protein
MIKLIALTGYKRSGKSTVADYLVEKYYFRRLRFANKLKEMLKVLGLNEQYIDSRKEIELDELCGKTTRYAMQTLGTEWGRKLIGDDIWVKQLQKEMNICINNDIRKFVIDDLRFENEEKFINSLRCNYYYSLPFNLNFFKVIIIKIERNGCIETDHESETYIKSIIQDWTIYNDLSKEDLYKSVDDIVDFNIEKGKE